jgi:hypothetical protein
MTDTVTRLELSIRLKETAVDVPNQMLLLTHLRVKLPDHTAGPNQAKHPSPM